jgi:uncharacterized protein YPO0396
MDRKLQNECFRIKRETIRHVRAVRAPQNMEAGRQSARRNAVALGISDRNVRRILHKDLNFHPYKMVVAQELSDRDMANHSTVADRLIGIFSDDVIVLKTD